MAKLRRRFLPHFDSLESRVVPAGNVIATLKGNILSIMGDNQANSITVTSDSAGAWTISGLDQTTINGSSNPFTINPSDPTKNKGKDKAKPPKAVAKSPVRLMVNMRGGDDTVEIDGGDVKVGKNTSIKLGQGNDTLTVDGLFAGDNSRYDGESGNDTITVTNSSFTTSALLSGGVGSDTINIDNVDFGKAARIDAGNGADFVKVTGSTFGPDARFNMGPGNDELELGSNTFSQSDRFDGGSGTDTLTDDGANTWAAKHFVKGFETIQEGGRVTAGNDAASVAPGGTVVISVLANDAATAPNVLNPASIVIITPPTGGTVTVNPDGTISYTNTSNVAGTDTFTYTVADNDGHVSNPATVTVTIGANNQPPVANNDVFQVIRGSAGVVLNLMANDTDPENQLNPASIVIVNWPLEGTLTVNADGTVSYSSLATSTATSDTFTYTIKDKQGLSSNLATVTIDLV